jgi:hypothetical protein
MLLLSFILIHPPAASAADRDTRAISVDHSKDHLNRRSHTPEQYERAIRKIRARRERDLDRRLELEQLKQDRGGQTGSSVQAVNITAQTGTFNTRDDFGDFTLMGEVKNTGGTSAVFVEINVNMYDSGNNLLGTDSTFIDGGYNADIGGGTFGNALGSGDTGFFILYTTETYANVDHYTYSFTYETYSHSAANATVAFMGSPTASNFSGDLRFTGTVRNSSGQYLTYFTEVYFAAYNASGKVIDVGSTFVDGTVYDFGSGTTDTALEPLATGPITLYMDAAYSAYSTNKYAFEWKEVLENPIVTHQLIVSTYPDNGATVTVSPNDTSSLGDGVTQFVRTYEEGAEVTLTAPASHNGKTFSHWYIDFVSYPTRTVTLTMDQVWIVTAHYQDAAPTTYTLTVSSSPSGAGITVSPDDVDGYGNGTTYFTRKYNEGTDVTLTAPASHNGQNFSHWTVGGSNQTARTIQVAMDQDKQATATYQSPPATTYSITVQSTPFSNIPVNFNKTDVNGNEDGFTSVTRTYNEGTYLYFGLPSDFNGEPIYKMTVNGEDFFWSSGHYVTMDKDYTVLVYYQEPPTKKLTVRSFPFSNVYISLGTPSIDGKQTGYTEFTYEYSERNVVGLLAQPTYNGQAFYKWTINGEDFFDNYKEWYMLNGDTTAIVYYGNSGRDSYTLNVSSSPDQGALISVTPDDAGGNGNGATGFSRTYDNGTVVTLTAPSTHKGNNFSSWTINGATKTTQTIQVTMNQNRSVKAYYQSANAGYCDLSVISTPASGVAIEVSPADKSSQSGGVTGFQRSYQIGTVVTLTAPAAFDGKSFSKWEVGSGQFESSRVLVLTMAENTTAKAIYETASPPPSGSYTLNIQSRPITGVPVSVSPGDKNGNGDGSTNFSRVYDSGTDVTVTAPDMHGGMYFSKWLLDGNDRVSRELVIPVNANRTAIAVYTSQPPTISLSRSELYFCYIQGGSTPKPQSFTITNSGGGSLDWSVADGSDVQCSPDSGAGGGIVTVNVDPSGLSNGSYSAELEITSSAASNSPRVVRVYLEVKPASQNQAPFGDFSTPLDNSTVMSSIAVTGWVVDDNDVDSVKLYREEGKALVYIGDAVFVEGARPDVEGAYPGYPANYKAGWGYMLLTNFLPGGGNGTFKLHAVASDTGGLKTTLGIRTIHCDNKNAVKPFGAIDTPAQGGTASGGKFVNWGWALTPQPNSIPIDGSTINVFVDGVKLGNPAYNVYRSDIATLFPGYANSDGAVGYFYLDTTAYEEGVHSIQWTARDSAGNTDGIGSRYFVVTNSGSSRAASSHASDRPILRPLDGASYTAQNHDIKPELPVRVSTQHIETRELERVEIKLHGPDHMNHMPISYFGYLLVNGKLERLPVGSTLDKKNRAFLWNPGPGHLGVYHLVFIAAGPEGGEYRQDAIVEIVPAQTTR